MFLSTIMDCLKRFLKQRIQLRRPRTRKAILCLIDRKPLSLSRIHRRNLRGKQKAMLLLLAYLAKRLIFGK